MVVGLGVGVGECSRQSRAMSKSTEMGRSGRVQGWMSAVRMEGPNGGVGGALKVCEEEPSLRKRSS